MPSAPTSSRLGALLVWGLFGLLPTGCRREDPAIRELTEKAAHADEASKALRQAWKDQFRNLALAHLKDLPSEQTLMLLTPEQRQALEARVKHEKGYSRRALLLEILQKDAQLRELSATLSQLAPGLPEPEAVRLNDSHYGLALRFLKRKGCTDAEARSLLSRAAIHDKIAPGFLIYHFYRNGTYGAWIAQGTASLSPDDLERLDEQALISARDGALGRMSRLKRELAELALQKRKIEGEMDALQSERQDLLAGSLQLREDEARQQARLNSLHYLVGVREALRSAGVIETPLFDRDRSGRAWRDPIFTQSLDLRAERTIVIRARDLGLERIREVSVVPGSYVQDEHYRLTLSADRQSATIELLNAQRFKNDKVVFAVAD